VHCINHLGTCLPRHCVPPLERLRVGMHSPKAYIIQASYTWLAVFKCSDQHLQFFKFSVMFNSSAKSIFICFTPVDIFVGTLLRHHVQYVHAALLYNGKPCSLFASKLCCAVVIMYYSGRWCGKARPAPKPQWAACAVPAPPTCPAHHCGCAAMPTAAT
jgi:hypothetical protein